MEIRIIMLLADLEQFNDALLADNNSDLCEYVDIVGLSEILNPINYDLAKSTDYSRQLVERGMESFREFNEVLIRRNPEAIYLLKSHHRVLADMLTQIRTNQLVLA